MNACAYLLKIGPSLVCLMKSQLWSKYYTFLNVTKTLKGSYGNVVSLLVDKKSVTVCST